MKRLAVALVASSALAFGALAQSSSGTSSQNQVSATTSQPGASRSDSVKVKANIRTGSRTTVRTRSDSPSVVTRTSRTRYVTTNDQPSRVTVIKKKKKYAKKKRTIVYSSQPSSTTVVERRRSPSVVATGVSRTRVVTKQRTGTSVGVTTRTRSTTGSSSSTSGSGGVNVQGTDNTR
jgi:hypothetical protein